MDPDLVAFAVVVGGYLLTQAALQPTVAGAIREQRLVPVEGRSGDVYHVMDVPSKHKAADLLARVRARAARVVRDMGKRYQHNPNSIPANVIGGVKRLIERTENGRRINVHELNPTKSPNLAFNRNKGEGIFMCLRQSGSPHGDDLADEDVLLYILLHELAHTMDLRYNPKKADGTTAHGKNFMTQERYIYSVASAIGELDPAAQPGKRHCGAIITHPQSGLLPSHA